MAIRPKGMLSEEMRAPSVEAALSASDSSPRLEERHSGASVSAW
jgi:hypothetical protein